MLERRLGGDWSGSRQMARGHWRGGKASGPGHPCPELGGCVAPQDGMRKSEVCVYAGEWLPEALPSERRASSSQHLSLGLRPPGFVVIHLPPSVSVF